MNRALLNQYEVAGRASGYCKQFFLCSFLVSFWVNWMKMKETFMANNEGLLFTIEQLKLHRECMCLMPRFGKESPQNLLHFYILEIKTHLWTKHQMFHSISAKGGAEVHLKHLLMSVLEYYTTVYS